MKKFRIVPEVYVYKTEVKKYYQLEAKDWFLGRWYFVKSADDRQTLKEAVGHLETEVTYL